MEALTLAYALAIPNEPQSYCHHPFCRDYVKKSGRQALLRIRPQTLYHILSIGNFVWLSYFDQTTIWQIGHSGNTLEL